MTINEWISSVSASFKSAGITSARLDAEILLAHTLKKTRTYLHAHGDEPIPERAHEIADARAALRIDRTPIAYIIGHKEFYGRPFKVTLSTLIPRPESEDIITITKNIATTKPTKRIVDVGTGSGCLGISAKLELPDAEVTLTDISRHALMVAKSNAAHLKADVTLIHGDLLSDCPFNADIIIANLPYVGKDWDRSPETNHEPSIALFAEHGGLALIESLLPQATSHLTQQGDLLIEAAPKQHQAIINVAIGHGFTHVKTHGFIIHLRLS